MDEGQYGNPTNMQEFDKQANQRLKPVNRKVVDRNVYELIKWSLWIFVGLVLVLGYAVLNDSFKSEISCPSCPTPATIPPCPECPSCPNISNNCDVQCSNLSCNFPSNLNIKLENSS